MSMINIATADIQTNLQLCELYIKARVYIFWNIYLVYGKFKHNSNNDVL